MREDNDDVVELGAVSEETHGEDGNLKEGQIVARLP